MIQIEPILLELPAKEGVKIMIRPIINSTTEPVEDENIKPEKPKKI